MNIRSPVPVISTYDGRPVGINGNLLAGQIPIFSEIPTTASLLSSPNVLVLPSDWPQSQQYSPSNAELTSTPILDARSFSITQINNSTSVTLGTLPYASSPPNVAFIGGLLRTTGDPSRVHAWWYGEFGSGKSLNVLLQPWIVLDGIRIDNCTDGIGTRSQFGGYNRTIYRISNCWIRSAHDDAIENDQFQSVLMDDCLIEDAFVGVSMRRSGAIEEYDGKAIFKMEHCLVGLGPQPIFNPDDSSSPPAKPSGLDENGNGHSSLWKLVAGGSPIAIECKDCIFYSPGYSYTGNPDFPPTINSRGAPASFVNCKLVWTGTGSYPGNLPSTGLTVTRDISIWNSAKQQWRNRHGIVDMDHVDVDKMIAPDPFTGWTL